MHVHAGNIGTKIRKDLPPKRRELAEALVQLYRHMGARNLNEAARMIAAKGYAKDPSEISRYLNGDRLPSEGFITCFFKAAAAAGGGRPPVAQEDLVGLHADAEPFRRCRNCADLGRANDRLHEENTRLLRNLAGLERRLAHARRQATLLPVPLPRGDRQQRASDIAAALNVSQAAAAMGSRTGQSAALALLHEATEVLSPAERAASVVLMRERSQNEYADTLILICGRNQPESDVMRVALDLYEHGLPDDAGAVLRAAVGQHAGTRNSR